MVRFMSGNGVNPKGQWIIYWGRDLSEILLYRLYGYLNNTTSE